jgi:hypothetical protein
MCLASCIELSCVVQLLLLVTLVQGVLGPGWDGKTWPPWSRGCWVPVGMVKPGLAWQIHRCGWRSVSGVGDIQVLVLLTLLGIQVTNHFRYENTTQYLSNEWLSLWKHCPWSGTQYMSAPFGIQAETVTLRLTVSQSVCLGVEPTLWTFDQILQQRL